MASVITIDQLSVTLGGRFKALRNITIDLPSGKIIGFIGPSGAGKTTLIRTIVGRQKPAAGSVMVLGSAAGAPTLRPKLRYMTQELSVYSDLTVMENLRYFAQMAGYKGKKARDFAARALDQVHMKDKANVLVGSLSGGQKQRASLAVALIGEPELLVLDEPTVGLDPVLREQLWQLFRELRDQGKTIIVSSHVMDEAERCDELVLLRDAQVVASGSPAELCRRTGTKTVEQSFLKLAGGQSS
jgi:ABC-type multidrug transport system ATPase subunit